MDVANHSVVLLQQLNVQREFGFLCDCTVAVGDIHFKAHRAVLAAFSNYFKMIFIHQSSDYIKMQPVDIQPDIFSYLLHLMYTGKGPKQPVDPNRLEEGIRFLHAYNLVHDPGHSGQVFAQHHEVLPLQSPNLYGIQISGSQKLQVRDVQPSVSRGGARAQTAEQPCPLPPVAAANIPEHRYARPPIGQDPSGQPGTEEGSPSSPAASRGLLSGGLQVPGLSFKRGKTHKLYSCHYCGERFSTRGSLRDHLYSHASGTLPSGNPTESRGLGDSQEAEKSEGLPTPSSENLLAPCDQQAGNSPDEQPPVGLTVTIGTYGDMVDTGNSYGAAKRRKFSCTMCGYSAETEPAAAPPTGPEDPAAAAPPAAPEDPATAAPPAGPEDPAAAAPPAGPEDPAAAAPPAGPEDPAAAAPPAGPEDNEIEIQNADLAGPVDVSGQRPIVRTGLEISLFSCREVGGGNCL
ncbi:zinc finger and BTB domain-containing protein 25-like [Narcine bancroftii]|uniref:zinc finger and BTB domain-containing protein 25-like n=1 Tax=Narcine bancroftii TaxID=1343680 RepID=UPI00383134F9